MTPTGPIIHDNLLAELGTNFFPQTGQVQELIKDGTGSRGPGGERLPIYDDLPLDADDIPDQLDIACRIAPAGGRELKRKEGNVSQATHKILLAGYYPEITPAMKFVSGGVTYGILVVHNDAEQKTTRLDCEVVK